MVYLCGGINGLSDTECKDWRQIAKDNLTQPTLDPMRRDYRGIEDANVEAIVQGDLDDISVSSVILVNASRPSWGTAMEIIYAYQQGKRIHAFASPLNPISPWLRYHCTFIHPTVEVAIIAINNEKRAHDRFQAVSI